MSKTLIFPISTPPSKEYLLHALDDGQSVVCASSDLHDPVPGLAPWFHLPIIHDTSFIDKFLELVQQQGVDRVFIGAHMVHAALREIIKNTHALSHLKIINQSPFEEELLRWKVIFERAEKWRLLAKELFPRSELAPVSLIAGTIRFAFHVFGESYDDKLATLFACLGESPDGDIVEIGSLFGRSACVLLAARNLGGFDRNVFIFDPWDTRIGAQKDLPANMLAYTQSIDLNPVCQAFEATMDFCAPSNALGAYRIPSEQGFKIYTKGMEGEAFRLLKHRRAIEPKGKIALLHIDGNHDPEPVMRDVELWSRLVAPGGWVVIDDYCWRYGNGPKNAGDHLLNSWRNELKNAFVIGDCLFIQRQ